MSSFFDPLSSVSHCARWSWPGKIPEARRQQAMSNRKKYGHMAIVNFHLTVQMVLVRYLSQWPLTEATSDGSGTSPKAKGDKLSPQNPIVSSCLMKIPKFCYYLIRLGVWSSKAASIFSSNPLYVPAAWVKSWCNLMQLLGSRSQLAMDVPWSKPVSAQTLASWRSCCGCWLDKVRSLTRCQRAFQSLGRWWKSDDVMTGVFL